MPTAFTVDTTPNIATDNIYAQARYKDPNNHEFWINGVCKNEAPSFDTCLTFFPDLDPITSTLPPVDPPIANTPVITERPSETTLPGNYKLNALLKNIQY